MGFEYKAETFRMIPTQIQVGRRTKKTKETEKKKVSNFGSNIHRIGSQISLIGSQTSVNTVGLNQT